jgi:uncharacterized protein
VSRPLQPLFRECSTGFTLRVRLTPKATTAGVIGVCDTPEGPALSARVRAIPNDGEANAALEIVIADWLGLAKSCVALTSGQKSRIKTVTVRGSPDVLLQRLAELDPSR